MYRAACQSDMTRPRNLPPRRSFGEFSRDFDSPRWKRNKRSRGESDARDRSVVCHPRPSDRTNDRNVVIFGSCIRVKQWGVEERGPWEQRMSLCDGFRVARVIERDDSLSAIHSADDR